MPAAAWLDLKGHTECTGLWTSSKFPCAENKRALRRQGVCAVVTFLLFLTCPNLNREPLWMPHDSRMCHTVARPNYFLCYPQHVRYTRINKLQTETKNWHFKSKCQWNFNSVWSLISGVCGARGKGNFPRILTGEEKGLWAMERDHKSALFQGTSGIHQSCRGYAPPTF